MQGAKDLVGDALVIQEFSCKKTEAGNHGNSTGVELKGIGQLLPVAILGLAVGKINPREVGIFGRVEHRRCFVLIRRDGTVHGSCA